MFRIALICLIAMAVAVILAGCPKPQSFEPPVAPPGQVSSPPQGQPIAPPPAGKTSAPEKPAADTPGSAVKVPGEEGKPVEKTASGLQYVVLDPGTGAKPNKGDKVVAEYTGWLTDGKKFDSSKDHPGDFSFAVGQGEVIPAWDEALSDMKIGERRKLIVPPALGYGAEGTPGGPIPPNATLVFEVKLVKVVK